MPRSPSLPPDALGHVPLFADLAEEQHRHLLTNHRLLTLEREQRLILEQDESQGLFLLRQGLLKVRCLSIDGEEAVLALLGPGDVCGEMASLNPKGLRSADVITLTPCSLVVLRGAPFASLSRSEPRLALALARLEAQRLCDLNKRFGLRGADASTRMLVTLAELASKTAPGAPATAPIPPLPQRELANLSGLARETASRILSALRQRGVVVETAEGGLRLTDLTPLVRRGLL
ncbi:MAG: Crp/Fnr family transcriptional regulator [Cyanobacteriota bacterium]|jgi:CRP/FNR family cyclic AMP-dependent transcriptional regulator